MADKKKKINLHSNPINKKEINFPVLKKPEIEELIKIGFECNKIIRDTPKIIKSITSSEYTINSKYFTSSEGSEILQNFTDVIMEMRATAHESGQTQSVNITEGGRGGLVGSVVAAAVILPPDFHLYGLTDSKKLSEKKRDSLYQKITEQCDWSVAEPTSIEIDQINIFQATILPL